MILLAQLTQNRLSDSVTQRRVAIQNHTIGEHIVVLAHYAQKVANVIGVVLVLENESHEVERELSTVNN